MHKPLPWYVTGLGTDESKWSIVQSAALDEDNFICECDDPEDARLIVSAVNAFGIANHISDSSSNS